MTFAPIDLRPPRTLELRFDLVAIGECMVELVRREDGAYQPGYAGDTFNTLFHAARLGLRVGFVSALGDDLFTPMILDGISSEGIDTAQLLTIPGRRNGLYFIETDETGERSFHYWRAGSAATQRLIAGDPERLEAYVRGANRVLVSGITLAIMEAADRLDSLFETIGDRSAIFLDANYRPALWSSAAACRSRLEQMLPLVDTFLPSKDDLAALWPKKSIEEIVRHCRALGVRSVVVKMGAEGCLIEENGEIRTVPAPPVADIVDTTGAGDAFNAGYIAGIARGLPVGEACSLGHNVAARVLQVRGAIDKEFTDPRRTEER